MELLVLGFQTIDFQTIDTWIETGGYIVLFGLLFACGLGLPLPEDIPLMIAGALVAKGKMHLAIAGIAAWCGIIGGDIMLYHLGKKFGLEITRLPFVGKHLTKARIERVEEMFDKYGIGVVGVGRLFAGVRGAMVVAAGAIRFNFVKFIITDGIAAIVSGGFFLTVGYYLGTKLNANTVSQFKHWFIAGACILALGVVLWVIWRRRRAPALSTRGVDRMEKVVQKVEQAAQRVGHATHITSHPPPGDGAP